MKALIFDMDGLMIDSERLYIDAQHEIAAKFDKKLKEETRLKMMGKKPLESIRLFTGELEIPLDAEEVLEMRNRLMRDKLKNDLEAMPGLFHILDTFYNKLKLAVCTGSQGEFLDIVVDKLGIRDRFAVLQDSDEMERGKPDPEIFLRACEKLELEPGQCVVLEDSLNGVLAGKRAGCHVIAVPSEYTKGEDFGIADYLAGDLFEAERYINDLVTHGR